MIVEDRHADTEALPFSTEERAVRYAREKARVNAAHPEHVREQELTPDQRERGIVLLVDYSIESSYPGGSDSVTVVKRTVDAGEPAAWSDWHGTSLPVTDFEL